MKLLNIKKIALASALVAGSIFSVNASAQSVNVTVGGINYTVTETSLQPVLTSLANPAYALTSQPWYGQSAIASQFVQQVQYRLGNWNGVTSSTSPSVLFITSTTPPVGALPGELNTVTYWHNGVVTSGVSGPPNIDNSIYAYITGYIPAPTGPSLANTQASVQNTAQAL